MLKKTRAAVEYSAAFWLLKACSKLHFLKYIAEEIIRFITDTPNVKSIIKASFINKIYF